MAHKMTKRETATIAALTKIERDEYAWLVKFHNMGGDLSTTDENIQRAWQVQLNRWSTAYKCLHAVEDAIMLDGREVYC